MANVFLDTNTFIDIVSKRRLVSLEDFQGHQLCISALSVHILLYVLKVRVPAQKIKDILTFFTIIPINQSIIFASIAGPTHDFEDNVQLHSAVEGECTFMVTQDKQLLNMIYFGKLQIVERI